MPKLVHLFLPLFLSLSIGVAGQSNKKYKSKKRTSKREMRKRQEEANRRDNTNAFNPAQPMGARQNDQRDDLLWHSESANTVYAGSGNISLVKPSRYGLSDGLEVSSVLPLNYWMPNIYLKKRWRNESWYVASRHGFYSGRPGLKWFNKRDNPEIVEGAEQIPFILSMKNELSVSRLIMNNDRCGRDKPYIILTGIVGVDFGIPFGDSDLKEMEGHFLTNRSPAITGSGYTAYLKARADWQMTSSLMLGGSIAYYRGDFTGKDAVEQSAELQLMLFPRLSASVAYALSVANYTASNDIGFLPYVDLTFYFGRRQGRQKGLFQGKMF
ncbi:MULTISPECIES: hypothetical protein [unclassified Carboxylicivirga]|uniref:hypothetical protein n=1 Tax=Carboxylicivirga TaxID=1628153 RepID=UPI003D34E642